MLNRQDKEIEGYKKELLSVHNTHDELKMVVNKDLQMRFALKHFKKKYEDDEMSKDIVLAFQIILYMLGEYDGNIDYSNEPELVKSFEEIRDRVIPTAKEVIEQNKETRELIFRFNKVTNYLFHKLFKDSDDILNNEILKNREKILEEYFTDPDEYPEPESSKRYLKYFKKFCNEVKEFEKMFRKTF